MLYKIYNDIRIDIINYDIYVIINHWIRGESFFEEREKWKISFK